MTAPDCPRHGYNPECYGTCLTGHDVGIPSSAIAVPDPSCPVHGRPGEDCECTDRYENDADAWRKGEL